MTRKQKTIHGISGKPWIPVGYDEALTGAVKALASGTANADQRQRALYRPGEDGRRDTDFHEGRRFVGNQIVKQLKLTTAP